MILLAAVTYFYTGSWLTVGWVTVLHHATFLIVYYIHERFWLHIDNNKPFNTTLKRSIFKAITYETILGNFILGIITLVITGDIQKMTEITLTYIGIKHFIFVWNEFIWKKRMPE